MEEKSHSEPGTEEARETNDSDSARRLVMLQSLPDARNGVSLRVVAENARAVSEAKAICHAIFPPYARPHEVTESPIPFTALGKTVRPKQNA